MEPGRRSFLRGALLTEEGRARARLAGLPYLDFTQGGCTFCGDCNAACPVDIPAISLGEPLGGARVVQARCLAWKNVICMSCISACRLDALSMDRQRRPTVDADRCSGRGFCVARCPVQALQVEANGSGPG